LLTNIIYIGKTRHKGEAFDAEHPAIITKELWDRVQKKLKHNGLTGGVMNINKHGALLRGILRCVATIVDKIANRNPAQCYSILENEL
jgi:site-specific DNA recombinase